MEGYSPWACKESDMTEQLSTHAHRFPIRILRFLTQFSFMVGFPCGSAGKESTCNAGDPGSIPGLGRSPGKGKGYPLQASLENSMDCIVHGFAKSWTRLSDFPCHGNTMFSFLRNHQSSKVVVPFCIPPSMSESFCCSISLLAFHVVSVLHFDHSDRCVISLWF